MEPTATRINRASLEAALNEASEGLKLMKGKPSAETFGLHVAYRVIGEALKNIGDEDMETLRVGRATINANPNPCPEDCFLWWKWCICIPWLASDVLVDEGV